MNKADRDAMLAVLEDANPVVIAGMEKILAEQIKADLNWSQKLEVVIQPATKTVIFSIPIEDLLR